MRLPLNRNEQVFALPARAASWSDNQGRPKIMLPIFIGKTSQRTVSSYDPIANGTGHCRVTEREVPLIQETLYGVGWGAVASPRLWVASLETALTQLPLSTISLAFFPPMRM